MAGIAAILLAAGRSTRFEGNKLLHPLSDGRPLGLTAARNLQMACSRCIAVLNPDQQALAEHLLGAGFQVHFSPATAQGMGHSLALTVAVSADADGWLVALADMPFIAPATITSVADAIQAGASLAAPYLGSRRGHPVGFGKEWFGQLAALKGDRGAWEILSNHDNAIKRIDSRDKGILIDIDTREDLARATETFAEHRPKQQVSGQ